MNYEELKTGIRAVIKENGNEEITGQILQDSLVAMINALGNGYLFAGIAEPETPPVPLYPDAKLFYIANKPGFYNFGPGYEVEPGELVIFYIPLGEWDKITIADNLPIIINVEWVQNPGIGMPHFTTEEYDIEEIARLAGKGKQIYLRGYSSEHDSYITLPFIYAANLGADGWEISYRWFNDTSDHVVSDTIRI